MYRRESLVSFPFKHDIIEIGLKQKGNVLCIVQPTMCSMLSVYDIQPPITSKLAAIFACSFSCSESRVHPHLIIWSLYPISTFDPQGCSEPGLNGLDNFYIPTSNLAICFFVLEDSSPSAETCFDTERSACPQAAAFLSRRTHITPSTYVYTSFVSDSVLSKSVAVGKTPKQALLFDCLLYWPLLS